jgi:hypothetical protein
MQHGGENYQLTSLLPQLVECELYGEASRPRVTFVNDNPLPNTALEQLKPLVGLEFISLGAKKVTRQGLDSLQQALPKCTVKSDF